MIAPLADQVKISIWPGVSMRMCLWVGVSVSVSVGWVLASIQEIVKKEG